MTCYYFKTNNVKYSLVKSGKRGKYMQHALTTLKKYVKQENDKSAIIFRKQGNIVMHNHDCFELAYIIEGSTTHTLDGKTETIHAGAYYIIDHGSLHSYTNSENIRIVNCLFLAEIIDAALTNCSSFDELMRVCMIRYYKQYLGLTPVNRIFYDEDGTILKLLEEMAKEYENRKIGYQEVFRGKLLEILILTMRKVIEQCEDVPIEKITDSAIIRVAVHYFEANYQDKALLSNFCQKHHYNTQYISRRFKKETGLTALEYLQKIRIEKSCDLLAGSKLTISEIAHQVGYDDIKFFNRVFHKLVGMTPGEYRKTSH